MIGEELGSFHKGLHVADDIRNLGVSLPQHQFAILLPSTRDVDIHSARRTESESRHPRLTRNEIFFAYPIPR